MKNILNTNDLLSLDCNLAPIKRRTISQMILFIFGVAAIFFGTNIDAPDILCYSLAVGGLITVIIAMGLIFSQPRDIINRKTNDILHKHKYYFHSKDEKEVIEGIRNGNLQHLLERSCPSGQLLTIIYSSPNNMYYVAQVFKFVPYEFQPYSAPIIYCKA